jgi:hypothetical protein
VRFPPQWEIIGSGHAVVNAPFGILDQSILITFGKTEARFVLH